MDRKKEARKYVGGIKNFEEAGRKQLDLLIQEGLKPEHKLLEIGCGNARAGVHFISYLDKGNYWGMDHNQWLIDVALESELTDEHKDKSPHFFVNDLFDFSCMGDVKPDFVIAKSVFTHLIKSEIKLCLNNVLKHINPDGAFYASITIGGSSGNKKISDDTKVFRYRINEIETLAEGWNVESLGTVGTYKQIMLKFTLNEQERSSTIS